MVRSAIRTVFYILTRIIYPFMLSLYLISGPPAVGNGKFDKNEASYYIGRGICYFDMDQQENAMRDYKTAAARAAIKQEAF